MTVAIDIELFTDPACPFAFSAEPVRQRLRWHYGEGLRWRTTMIVLTLEPGEDKKSYWEQLAIAPWQARLIKMADALDHLNGPPEYLADRLKSARKALALASSPEPEIQRAATVLSDAIDTLSSPSLG